MTMTTTTGVTTMSEQPPSKDIVELAAANNFEVHLQQLSEIERLRRALRGIASCSTCERCRGAATLALGEDKPQAWLDDETLLTIARQWDQGPGETFEFDTPTLLRFMRSFAATVEGVVRDGVAPEPATERASVFANPITDSETFVVTAAQVEHYEQPTAEPAAERPAKFPKVCPDCHQGYVGEADDNCCEQCFEKFNGMTLEQLTGNAPPPGDGQR